MGVFGFGIVVGLLLTRERKAFASIWIWMAGLIAFAVFLPNLIWNVQHNYPFLQLMHNIRESGRRPAFHFSGLHPSTNPADDPGDFLGMAAGWLVLLLFSEG